MRLLGSPLELILFSVAIYYVLFGDLLPENSSRNSIFFFILIMLEVIFSLTFESIPGPK